MWINRICDRIGRRNANRNIERQKECAEKSRRTWEIMKKEGKFGWKNLEWSRENFQE